MHVVTRSMFALALIAIAVPAAAAEFTLLIHETAADFDLRGESVPEAQAYWKSYAAYGEALKAAGVLRGGAALRGDGDAVTLSGAQTRPGAQARAATQLGGYFTIDVADRDAALDWARKAPALSRGGAVEIRPAYLAPTMMR